jgi:hypothetical protein
MVFFLLLMHLLSDYFVFLIEYELIGLTMMKKVLVRFMALGVPAVMLMAQGCYYYGPCVNGSGPLTSEIRDIRNFTGVTNTGSFEVYVSEADTFGVEVLAQENLLSIIDTYVSNGSLVVETKNGACYRSGLPVEVHVSLPELDRLRLTGSGKLLADVAVSPEVELTNSGSGLVEIDTVYAESYAVGNSGSGTIAIDGAYVDEADLVQSGSGNIFGGILFGTADLGIRHSSSGEVQAILLDGTLVDVILSGSGKVDLTGDAVVAEYSLNSSGRIDALDLEVADVDATSTGSGPMFVWATDLLDATITGSGDIIYRGNPDVSTTITGSGSVRPY